MTHVLRTIRNELSRLTLACDGNIAIIFGLTVPVLISLAGLGLDSASFYNQQTRMQSGADSTALAVGKEMHLYTDDLGSLGIWYRTR